MTPNPLSEIKKIYVEWHVTIALQFLDQILKSPEMISETNKLSIEDINKIKQDQQNIVTRALELEADELIKKNKIKNSNELFDVINNMTETAIKNIRRKFLIKVIQDSVKNG